MSDYDEQAEIDAALDAALNELTSDNLHADRQPDKPSTTAKTTAAESDVGSKTSISDRDPPLGPTFGPHKPPSFDGDDADRMFLDVMQMLNDTVANGDESATEEVLKNLMRQMQTQIATDMGSNNKASACSGKAATRTKRPTPASTAVDPTESVENAITDLVANLETHVVSNDSDTESETNLNDQDMFRTIFQNMDGLGDGDADAMIDGMLEQLVGKDLMYEPMKQVTSKFPDWLRVNKEKLSEDEYNTRCKQYMCFSKLVATYDDDPSNTKKLMSLMQEVQEYGQPPPEIIKDIAPGLELDADGMPKLDALANNEECLIM